MFFKKKKEKEPNIYQVHVYALTDLDIISEKGKKYLEKTPDSIKLSKSLEKRLEPLGNKLKELIKLTDPEIESIKKPDYDLEANAENLAAFMKRSVELGFHFISCLFGLLWDHKYEYDKSDDADLRLIIWRTLYTLNWKMADYFYAIYERNEKVENKEFNGELSKFVTLNLSRMISIRKDIENIVSNPMKLTTGAGIVFLFDTRTEAEKEYSKWENRLEILEENFFDSTDFVSIKKSVENILKRLNDSYEIHKFRGKSAAKNKREPIPETVKVAVWKRDDGKCVTCGSNKKLEYDHIIPVVKGGSNTARNIQLLCEKCNRTKSAKIK